MAPTNNLAFTAPLNPPNTQTRLTTSQIWAGLLLKCRSAETFVPAAIQSTTVLSDTIDPTTSNTVVVREVLFRESQQLVKEVVTAFEPCRVEFEQPDGSRISNVVSEGADGELYLTYIFEWRHPGLSEEELENALVRERRMSRQAVEGTINVLRRLVEEGKL